MFFNIFSGYEDARKKSSDGSYLAEIKNYTHAAEDSLRGTSKILLVSCLVIMVGFEFKFSFLIVCQ